MRHYVSFLRTTSYRERNTRHLKVQVLRFSQYSMISIFNPHASDLNRWLTIYRTLIDHVSLKF